MALLGSPSQNCRSQGRWPNAGHPRSVGMVADLDVTLVSLATLRVYRRIDRVTFRGAPRDRFPPKLPRRSRLNAGIRRFIPAENRVVPN